MLILFVIDRAVGRTEQGQPNLGRGTWQAPHISQ